jgi:holo-[acyl-carrier protein] synthase
MIFGTGCDLVDATRFERPNFSLEHFARKIFSARELSAYQERSFPTGLQRMMFLAKRFAAKEAVAKALGTGFNNGLHLAHIEVFNDDYGCPYVELNAAFRPFGKVKIFLSLSDENRLAQAFAVIDTDENVW